MSNFGPSVGAYIASTRHLDFKGPQLLKLRIQLVQYRPNRAVLLLLLAHGDFDVLQQLEIVLPLVAQIPPFLRRDLLLLYCSFDGCFLVGAFDEDTHVDVDVLQKLLQRWAGACCLLELLGGRRVELFVGLEQLEEEGL